MIKEEDLSPYADADDSYIASFLLPKELPLCLVGMKVVLVTKSGQTMSGYVENVESGWIVLSNPDVYNPEDQADDLMRNSWQFVRLLDVTAFSFGSRTARESLKEYCDGVRSAAVAATYFGENANRIIEAETGDEIDG